MQVTPEEDDCLSTSSRGICPKQEHVAGNLGGVGKREGRAGLEGGAANVPSVGLARARSGESEPVPPFPRSPVPFRAIPALSERGIRRTLVVAEVPDVGSS